MSLRTQGTTLFSAILVLVATTVVLQLWLLTFSMEALLRRKLLDACSGGDCLDRSLCPERRTPALCVPL